MQVKRIYSFDDMPLGSVIPYSGVPTVNNGSVALVNFNDQKWLSAANATASYYIPLANIGLTLNQGGKTVIGARIYSDQTAKCNYLALWSGSAYFQAIIGSDLGLPSAGTAYVECCINWENNTIGWYVNGSTTPAWSKTYTAAQMASIVTTPQYWIIGGYASGGSHYSRDISIREYAVGEAYVPWKSPRLAKIDVANVVAPGYNASNADTPTNVLNTPFADLSTGLSAPSMDSIAGAGSTQPITADLSLKNSFQGNFLGIEVFDTAKSTEAAAGTYTGTVTQGGVSVSGSFAVSSTMTYRKTLVGAMTNSLGDGTPWTKAKINATKLKLAAA